MLVRLCLFWVKITSGNAFPEMRLFGWSGKFYFPEIEIRWPKKKAFDHGNHFTLLFSLQSIFGKWERERERERARNRDLQSAISPSLIAISSPRCRWSRSRLREIASDRDRDRRRDLAKIAISPSRDCAVDRDLGSWSTARSSDGVQCRRWWFFPGLWLVFFWICVFLLLFQTPENIFRKIFWNATKHHGNIFLFRKLAFPKNMYFPENVFQQPNTA